MAPTRTCVGCRRAQPADELIRIVRRADGSLAVDRHGPGRGAWLCQGSLPCLEAAAKRDAFGRALASPVERAEVQRLRAQLDAAWGRPTSDVRGWGAGRPPGPESN